MGDKKIYQVVPIGHYALGCFASLLSLTAVISEAWNVKSVVIKLEVN